MKGSIIHKMAAKSFIKDLEQKKSYLHDQTGKIINGDIRTVLQKIVDISLKNQIMSKYTAFLAVETRSEKTQGNLLLRKMEIKDLSDPEPQETSVIPVGLFSTKISGISSFNTSNKVGLIGAMRTGRMKDEWLAPSPVSGQSFSFPPMIPTSAKRESSKSSTAFCDFSNCLVSVVL
jgi:hypothetical protein